MILKIFFVNSDISTQQEIVSSLLAISTESSSLITSREDKVVTFPHCHSTRIRANRKLKEVQHYLCNGCKKKLVTLPVNSSIKSKRKTR